MNFPRSLEKRTKKQILRIAIDGLVTMGMPFIIIGGVLGGVFTATESANIACLYALFLGVIAYRNYHLNDFLFALGGIARQMANIFLIISFSSVFAWVMGKEKVPEAIAAFMLSISDNKYLLLLMVNIFLLIVGMWMDTGAAIILFAPILAPIMYKVGIAPVHFAVIMLLNLTIGLVTPPVGVVLYAGAAVGKRKFEDVVKALVPFMILAILVLAIVCFVPQTATWLPTISGFLD